MKSIQNRNNTFNSLIDNLPSKRKEVYKVIKRLVKCSLDDIINEIGVNKNEISGRITELKETCYIKECEESKISTRSNNKVTVYECIFDNIQRKELLEKSLDKIDNDIFLLSFYLLPNSQTPERLIYLINKDLKYLESKSKRINKELKKIKND